jgi:protein-tyrosine kinase
LPSLPGSYRSELLSSPQMAALLSDIVTRYESRLIIFDLPALLDDDDALVFAPYADATLLVVEDGVSKRSEIERSLQLLEGTRLLGTVLNKVR